MVVIRYDLALVDLAEYLAHIEWLYNGSSAHNPFPSFQST